MHKNRIHGLLAAAGVAAMLAHGINAAPCIVENGRPMADIVIAEHPPRMVKLAALELQHYVEKISRAKLPIVAEPGSNFPVRIYVGKSAFTDKLGVMARPGTPQADDDLKYGAFRMVSGPDYLVLLGHDFNFEPKKPWARSNSDIPRAQAEWDKITGATWGCPMTSLFRDYNPDLGTWFHDQAGSFNAVCEFLRTLGVRWYMPGDLGEVVPEMKSIPLPKIDRSVHPDYPVRRWFGAYFAYNPDTLMWDLRLGMNSGAEVLGVGMHVHGMRLVLGHKELFATHPEYYALDGGKRNPEHGCFSSTGLVYETANFARAVFDHYNEPVVSVWPNDGLRKCQCDQCRGIPDSDYVFGFVDRVAREVYKTHPDKLISAGAYASYREPPQNIKQFSPNVLLFLAAHRPGLDHPEQWQERMALVDGWRAKLAPGRMIRNANNYYDLVFHPRSFARELQALKGIALGDWNEVRRGTVAPGTVAWHTPGIDHLNQYVNARFLWDSGQDLDALLEEYYKLFYGPARVMMKAALEYAEANYTRPGQAQFVAWTNRIQFVEMLHAAREEAGANTVYGRRIQLLIDAVQPLERMRESEKLERLRDAEARAFGTIDLANDKWQNSRNTFVLDGKLDEPFWTAYPHGAGLQNAATGKRPAWNTSFMARWYKNQLYIGIRCQDATGMPLNITSTNNGNPAILNGDRMEILLETDLNLCYRIVVNPAGALLDMDMTKGGAGDKWASNADAAACTNAGGWSVEVRIPVVPEEEGKLDPLHNVVGRRPSETWPWHFNVLRVRVRGQEEENSSFAPTDSDDLHDRLKFGKFYCR